jgi:transcriptional regulator with XRE-family HTH domain
MSMIRNTVVAKEQTFDEITATQRQALGSQIRAHRKGLRISAVATAEAAGISRVTLHRIEKGEASVAMGAYCRVLEVLGLDFKVAPKNSCTAKASALSHGGWIPARIPLADYPQLTQLAWQVRGSAMLTPAEALDIYERNARHLDLEAMTPPEKDLFQALRLAFSHEVGNV